MATTLPQAPRGRDPYENEPLQITLDKAIDISANSIRASLKRLYVNGYAAINDGGAGHWRRVASEPSSSSGKFRSVDRFLPSGDVDTNNGGWWQLDESELTPEMFGAVGDGVTLDDTALSAAIEALDTFRGSLKLGKDKTYLISQPLSFTGFSNITISGGPNTKIMVQSEVTGDAGILLFTECNWVRVENLYLDGNRENQTPEYSSNANDSGICATDCNDIYIENCDIYNTVGSGIRNRSSNRFFVEKCRGGNFGYIGLFLAPQFPNATDIYHMEVRDCQFDWGDSDPYTGYGVSQGKGSGNRDIILEARTQFTASAVSGTSITVPSGHPFEVGDLVKVFNGSGTLPGGLTTNTAYWVVAATATTIDLAIKRGGSAVSLTAGSGTCIVQHEVQAGFTVTTMGADAKTFDATSVIAVILSENAFVVNSHQYNQDQPLWYMVPEGETAVGGMSPFKPDYSQAWDNDVVYYVEWVNSNRFRLKLAPGNSPIVELSSLGTGTHQFLDYAPYNATVESYDYATSTATVEVNVGTTSVPLDTTTPYVIRQGISDRSLITMSSNFDDTKRMFVGYVTGCELRHEERFPSGYHANIQTQYIHHLHAESNSIYGGGFPVSIAEETDTFTFTNNTIEAAALDALLELANGVRHGVVSDNVFRGRWRSNVGIKGNGAGNVQFAGNHLEGILNDGYSIAGPIRFNGTATAGSANSITLPDSGAVAFGNSSDKIDYNGMTIFTTGGTGAGQERQIISYDPDTDVAVVTPVWSVAPDATTTAEIYEVAKNMTFVGGSIQSVNQAIRFRFVENSSVKGGSIVSYAESFAPILLDNVRDLQVEGLTIVAPNCPAAVEHTIALQDRITAESVRVSNLTLPAHLTEETWFLDVDNASKGRDVQLFKCGPFRDRYWNTQTGAWTYERQFRTAEYTVADDAVIAYTPDDVTGILAITVQGDSGFGSSGIVSYQSNTPSASLMGDSGSPLITVNTGSTPTGTTGTNGRFNVYVNNGSIYFENRLGGERTFAVRPV